MRFDYSGGENVVYSGYAVRGTATSAPSWTITKYTYITTPGGDDVVTQADMAPMRSIWDDRASLTYT